MHQIDKPHFDEWIASGVAPPLIHKNVRTIADPAEVDEILNRNTTRRWKHSTELTPAWVVTGVDPTTGERTLLGAQVKPDVSPVWDGKPQKYLSASDQDVSPLFLETAQDGYWQSVLANPQTPIIITEGAKKAGAALTCGYACISIPGVSTGQKLGRLRESLKGFAVTGRRLYLAFDNDVMTKKPVQFALDKLGKLLSAEGCCVFIVQIPPGAAKGLDDYYVSQGQNPDAIKTLIDKAATFEEWRAANREEPWTEEDCKLATNYRNIRDLLGERLRYNTLTQEIELDRQPAQAEKIRLALAVKHGIAVGREDCQDILMTLAQENEYSPIQEYLEDCFDSFGGETAILDGFAAKYFGVDDPIFDVFIKRTLLAAVARTFRPGCKVDTVLILQGGQGVGKSTFFRILASPDWFDDSLGPASDKDERLKLHRAWFIEWAELESIFKRKDVAATKAFLSCPTDLIRKPYGRTVESLPRKSIIVGTTNQDEFLSDATGNRRFWVIPVQKPLDIELLQAERDRIWAAAVTLFRQGEQWHLTELEAQAAAAMVSEFEHSHPWEEPISAYVEYLEEVTTSEILTKCLSIELGRQNSRGDQMIIADILKKLGWEQRRGGGRSGGRPRVWKKKELFCEKRLDQVGSQAQNPELEPKNVIQPQESEVGTGWIGRITNEQNVIQPPPVIQPDPTSSGEVGTHQTQSGQALEGVIQPDPTSEATFREKFPRGLDVIVLRSKTRSLTDVLSGVVVREADHSVLSYITGRLHDGVRVKLVSGDYLPVAYPDLLTVAEYNRLVQESQLSPVGQGVANG